MRRWAAAAALTALLTAACGSTVQVKGTASVGDGLGPEQQSGLTTGGSTGTATTGTGGTSGSGGTTGLTQGGTTGTSVTGTGGQVGVPGTSGTGSTGAGTSGGTKVGNHDPIQIGFVTTSVGNAAALGINAGSTYTDRQLFDALVAEYNAQGGVAGHKIVPVYGDTDTASSNWSNQFAQACAKFTQDNKVKVVIGYVFVFLPSFESCLQKAHVPHLDGGYQPGDVVDQRTWPTLVGTGHPTVDGADLAALEGALRTGLLNAKTKLGLIIDSCADGDRAYRNHVEPWLKQHKVDYQAVFGACSQGASDVSGAASAISNAELKFAASGVNLVFSNAVELLIFMQDAQSQGYTPEYLMGVGGAALEANAPASQMKHLHGFGWMPSVDVNPQHQPYGLTAAQKSCVAKLARHGLKPALYNDFMAAYQACDGIDLYARALAATGSTDANAIAAAVQQAMGSFLGAGTYGGAMRSAGTQHGGPAVYRPYAWDTGCSCLTYRGATYPIPTP